jgi:hypothetical protein
LLQTAYEFLLLQSVAVTSRLSTVASQVPALLDLYFDVLIMYSEEAHLKDLVPLLFDRLEQVGMIKPELG